MFLTPARGMVDGSGGDLRSQVVERGIQVELLVHAKASSMRVILKPANCLECEALEFLAGIGFPST
jgi:hypothetical protein